LRERPATQPLPLTAPSALERIAEKPQHRWPQPNEERAALGISPLALIVCLGPDPQADAEKHGPDRHQMQLPTSQAGAMYQIDQHDSLIARSHSG
jgi:hypothetical protein